MCDFSNVFTPSALIETHITIATTKSIEGKHKTYAFKISDTKTCPKQRLKTVTVYFQNTCYEDNLLHDRSLTVRYFSLVHFLCSSSITFTAFSAIQYFHQTYNWCYELNGSILSFLPVWVITIFHFIKRQHSNITLKNEFIVEDPSCYQGFLTMAVLASDREKTKVGFFLLWTNRLLYLFQPWHNNGICCRLTLQMQIEDVQDTRIPTELHLHHDDIAVLFYTFWRSCPLAGSCL